MQNQFSRVFVPARKSRHHRLRSQAQLTVYQTPSKHAHYAHLSQYMRMLLGGGMPCIGLPSSRCKHPWNVAHSNSSPRVRRMATDLSRMLQTRARAICRTSIAMDDSSERELAEAAKEAVRSESA